MYLHNIFLKHYDGKRIVYQINYLEIKKLIDSREKIIFKSKF